MTFVRLGLLLTLGVGSAALLGTSSLASAQTDQGSDGAARTYFDQGRAAYEAGQFEEASRLLRRAYLLSPRFALLYNIGQAELRAGHDALALEAFEGFLRQAPADDTRRSEVEERARVLRSLGVTPTTGGTVTPDTTVTTPDTTVTTPDTTVTTPAVDEPVTDQPASETQSGGDATPWIVVGIGGAVLVAGGVLIGVGVAQGDTAANAGTNPGTNPVDYADWQGQVTNANTLLGVGVALTAVGAVGTAVGVIWAVSSGPSSSSTSARLHVVPNGLLLEGAF